jgi:hypothetical protein
MKVGDELHDGNLSLEKAEGDCKRLENPAGWA